MKVFKITIGMLLLVLVQLPSYAQSEKHMTNKSLILPLKTGKNPSVQWESLVIAPVNLFIQTKPINTASPQIQLELNVVEGTKRYTSFLWYYDVPGESGKTNYPKAFQNYAFDLKIDKDKVGLVVTKLAFEKALFLDVGQTAVIGNLAIQFKDASGEWSVDINGNQTAAFTTYTISVAKGQEQQALSFTSLDLQVQKELALVWQDYKILILEATEKAVKLMVVKND